MTLYFTPATTAVLTFLASIAIARCFTWCINRFLRSLAKKTATRLDDILIEAVGAPFSLLIIIAGAYFSISNLDIAPHWMTLISHVFFVAITLALAWLVQRIISSSFPILFSVNQGHEKTPKIISRIINGAVYFVAGMTILSHFHIEITPLVTTLGIGGLAVGLALQETLSNFFAGLHLISDKPINVGDYIEFEGIPGASKVSGYVEDIGWRSTKCRTRQNTVVVVPNAKLSQSVIVNFSRLGKPLMVPIQFRVPFDSDLEKVEHAITEAALLISHKTRGAIEDADSVVRFHTPIEDGITVHVEMGVESVEDRDHVISEFLKAVKKRLDKERVRLKR